MKRFLLASALVALIPFAVALAELIRTQGTFFAFPAALSFVSLAALLALIPLQRSIEANHLTEKLEIFMMWFVLILFAVAIILRWGNAL